MKVCKTEERKNEGQWRKVVKMLRQKKVKTQDERRACERTKG